jgi:hypothetical protein
MKKASRCAAVAVMAAALCAAVASPAGATHSRPKAATPFTVSLVPASEPCASPNRVHAGLSFGSCNPPAQATPNVTLGTPDNNSAPAKGTGVVQYRVVGTAGGVDDLDVVMTTSLIDIRCRSGVATCGSPNTLGGADYVGELETNSPMQITDHNNESGTETATMQQIDFAYPVACAATSDPTVGATCAASTSMDALVPLSVPEMKRMLVELDAATVWDGGPDGIVDTPDNSLAFVQGVMIP